MASIISPIVGVIRPPIVSPVGPSNADWLLTQTGMLWSMRPDPGFVTSAGGDGTAVSAAADRSGGGDPLIQNTGLNKPTLTANWRNGKAALLFGSTKLMLTTAAHCPSENYSWGGVVEFTSLTGSRCPFALGTTGVPGFTEESGNWNIRYIGSTNCVDGAASTGPHDVVITRATGVTGVTKLYIDGVEQSLTPNAVSQGTPSGALVTGALDSSKTFGFAGYVAEQFLMTGVLSQAQVTARRVYTAARWGF